MNEDTPEKLRTLRGFMVRRPVDATSSNAWYSNPAIDDLYRQAHENPSLIEDWEFQKKALGVIVGIYRASPNFLYENVCNRGQVSPRAVDFIVSTIQFIATGRRSVMPELWYDILPVYPEVFRLLTTDELSANRSNNELALKNIEELISKWVSHRGGFRDLIISTAIFFGGELNNG